MTLIRRMAIASITVFALSALGGCFKTTGGGWFEDGDGDFVTFAFTAQPVGEPTGECDGYPFPFPQIPTCQAAKGRLTLIDHGTVTGEAHMIRGTFTGTYNPADGNPEDGSQFAGTAIVDGEEYLMGFRVTDAGEPGLPDDYVFLMLEPAAGGDLTVYTGFIGNGNVQVHAR